QVHGGTRVEDSPLEGDRHEAARAAEHGFRLAEEEMAAFADRVVKARENAVLEVAVEVDEHVAADEEVEMRERGVLGEVVTPEDAPLPEVAPEAVQLPLRDEVPLEQLTRHVLHVVEAIEAGAGRGERVFVDVGRVD